MKKLLLSLIIIPFSMQSYGAQITVTSNNDAGAGTLRDAVLNASNSDTITFNLSAGNESIDLTTTGVIEINMSITIDGANLAGSGVAVTIHQTDPTEATGNQLFRILNTATGEVINMKNLTLTDGVCVLASGTGSNFGGGAIGCEAGTLNIDKVTFINNHAFDDDVSGGAISIRDATANITNSTFTDNNTLGTTNAGNTGGAIFTRDGNVVIKNCTFSFNYAKSGGGAIGSFALSTPNTFLEVTNCTFTENESNLGEGGAMNIAGYTASVVTLKSNTFVANTCFTDDGGAVYVKDGFGTPVITFTIQNNIFANNTGNGDFFTTDGSSITNNGSNIVESSIGFVFNATGDITGAQADLFGTGLATQTLADNGGPTKTLALELGSVAIGAGISDASYPNDQRGVLRQSPPSIGAFDLDVTLSVSETSTDLEMSVYPNPTTQYITLKVKDDSALNYELYDLQGKLIVNNKIKSNTTSISLENLQPASYFLKVLKNKQVVKTFKIIKE